MNAGDQPSDDDLITTWGLVVEGYTNAGRALQAEIAAHSGLCGNHFEVLVRLRRTPGERLPMTQLANEVSFSSGGFTKLADRMECVDLVRRVGCEHDRRVTWIELTPAGRRTIDEAMEGHTRYVRAYIVEALGPKRYQQLGEIMRIVRDAEAPPID